MTEISRIDREIDLVRKELRGREKVRPMSAASWQAAWDKHPDLRLREVELFGRRGVAQKERDEKAHKDWVRERRIARSKRCPTCKAMTL